MGQQLINSVVQALADAGYAVERGYPQGKMRSITQPVCAVNLQSADFMENQLTILVQVLSPLELGAESCEAAALEVGEVLNALSGQCSIGACRYDSRTALFSVDVTIRFSVDKPAITVDGQSLRYVQSFNAWRTVDSTVTVWSAAKWHFQVEEWIPAGQEEQTLPEEAFTLTYAGPNGKEQYTAATWTYQKREWSGAGIRQIRSGVADSMEISTEE